MDMREKALNKKKDEKADNSSTGEESTDDSVKLGGHDLGAT